MYRKRLSSANRGVFLPGIVGAILYAAALPLGAQEAVTSADAARTPMAQTVRPFVEKSCVKCHKADLMMGTVNFEQLLGSRDSLVRQRAVWESVMYVLRVKRMPPQGEPVPAEADVAAVIEAVNQELSSAAAEAASADALAGPVTPDWVTFNYDAERTGWARAEKVLSKENVGRLHLLWKAQLDAVPNPINVHSTITAPLVVENVETRQGPKTLVFVASAENNVYAIDKDSGKIFWQRNFPNTQPPPRPASRSCPNNLNATPVIDKANGTIYFLATDGKLRGLSLSDGEQKFVPTSFLPAYSRNFSLNLIDGVLYAGTARGCGDATSQIAAIDLNNPEHPVSRFFPSTGKGSGPWGGGGIVKSPSGVLAQTADGAYDPAAGRFGNTVLGLTADVRLTDSYTPANEAYLNMKDFDLGSGSPIVFPFGKWNLIATAAKEGVIYLLDSRNLGGDDHRTPLYVSPRYGNDELLFGFNGVWSPMSTWVDSNGKRWLLVPMLGPPAKDTVGSFKISHGPVVNGSIMAFTVQLQDDKPMLVPEWISADFDLPGTPVIANDMLFVLATGERASAAFRPNFRGRPGGPGGPGGPGPGGQRPGSAAAGPGGPGGPTGARPAGQGGPGGQRRPLPLIEVNPDQPGFERDAAWRAAQLGEDGQTGGRRYSGGRDVTHAVIYALDAVTGEEIYTSGEAIDSWNHYGTLALTNGNLYLSTYDARVYAFGIGDAK